MKFPKLKEDSIYRILWIDNNIVDQKGWMNDQAISIFMENEMGTTVKSVGHFLKQDKQFVTIYGDIDTGTNSEKMRLINIIKSNITQIQECSMKKIFERK